jgi:hypothetical protein
MKIIFYIIIKDKRKSRFETAMLLDKYVKSKKFPTDTKIQFVKDGKIVGEILMSNYLKFEKVNK